MIGKTMVCLMAAALGAGCGRAAENATVPKVETAPGKILIAYYSWSGNTRSAAEQIRKLTGGTIFEIRPVQAYPSDYRACVAQAKKECRDEFKPELAATVEDFSKYDVIFVGTPNWWSTMAPPVRSFLDGCDFTGKTVIPFVTHGGGGMADCERDIRKACPGAVFGRGGAFSGSGIQNDGSRLAEWVKSTVKIVP